MIIAPGVAMLAITAEVQGRPTTVNPCLIWDDSSTILVDCGFPGQLPLIRAAVAEAGVDFNRLDNIILTHHDLDHIGSLRAIVKERAGGVKVLAHEVEKAYIQGDKAPHKLAQMEASLNTLPENTKAFYKTFKAGFAASYTPVDQTLSDGEVLPCRGGIQVIHTPGHTLGHICLYLAESKTLIAGDTLTIDGSRLTWTPQRLNHDDLLSQESLKKLSHFDIHNVVCYHGGLYQGDAARQIRAMAG